MSHLRITVLSAHEAVSSKDPFTHVVTTLSGNQSREELAARFSSLGNNWKQFTFDDVEEQYVDHVVLATHEQVAEMIDFFKSFKDDINLLVHCHAGVSRSTAVAYLALCSLEIDPKEALFFLMKLRPQLWPNLHILKLGSEILNNPDVYNWPRAFKYAYLAHCKTEFDYGKGSQFLRNNPNLIEEEYENYKKELDPKQKT